MKRIEGRQAGRQAGSFQRFNWQTSEIKEGRIEAEAINIDLTSSPVSSLCSGACIERELCALSLCAQGCACVIVGLDRLMRSFIRTPGLSLV
mmetsp:Transcript_31735/g.62838  ORF Transcript_31735/g.62838 Transcript_31735/m.62838 type:complete len:92 (-) Transcript_31735:231-506(-)